MVKYKTDLLKCYETLSEEQNVFAKKVKITLQKFSVL